MAINKIKILNALKGDLRASEPAKRDLDGKKAQWLKEANGEPYGNEVKGKSSVVSMDIKKQNLWQHASIVDPFVSSPEMISTSPVTFEDRAASEQNEVILNSQMNRNFERYEFFSRLVKVLQNEGTVYVRTGWEYEDEEEEVEVPLMATLPDGQQFQYGTETKTQTKVIKNMPTSNVCRGTDIFVDPTAEENIENAQFVIYRFKSNLSELKADGRYSNLGKELRSDDEIDDDDIYTKYDDASFEFGDEPRKQLDIYEYWGNYDMNSDGIAEPIVCTWVGDTIIRLEDNPFPDKKIPFLSYGLDRDPFDINGTPNAELISTDQKIKTGIKRAIIDNMANSTNGQKGIKKGSLDVLNKRRFLAGNNYEFNGSPNDMVDGSFNAIPNSVFDFYNVVSNDIESLTGVKSFQQGIGGASLGTSATASRGIMDSTARRELDIVRGIKESIVVPMLRKWTAYNAVWLSDEEVVRITNDEFVTIKRDDLDGSIDIDITVSTAEMDQNRSQELAFLLQTMGPNMEPGMTKIIMSEIMELKKMPDVAKQIRDFEPQPDPAQIKIQELQIAKLEAEVFNEQAKGQENAVDVDLKKAKTQTEIAKAADLSSTADLKDLDYLDKESGAQYDRDQQMANEKAASESAKAGQTNRANIMQQAMSDRSKERQAANKPKPSANS